MGEHDNRGDPLGLRLAEWWEDAIRRNNDAGMVVRRLEGDPGADPPRSRVGTDAEIAAARAENLRWWAAAEQRHRDLCLYVERGIVPAGFEVTP